MRILTLFPMTIMTFISMIVMFIMMTSLMINLTIRRIVTLGSLDDLFKFTPI
ncbi:MAG: hypothetical protein WCL00_09445 [Bacteroidota bacterium]